MAYDNGHVALFDVRSGVLSNALEVSDTAVLAVASHELKPILATGHEDKVILTDFKTNATIATIAVASQVQSLQFINQGLSLLAGHADGSITVYDMKTFSQQGTF